MSCKVENGYIHHHQPELAGFSCQTESGYIPYPKPELVRISCQAESGYIPHHKPEYVEEIVQTVQITQLATPKRWISGLHNCGFGL